MPDVLGYARVSTAGQDLEAQRRRLRVEGGALRVFEDVASSRSFDRPGLAALLDCARSDDTVCVVRLDRLGRSLRELLETVEGFGTRGLAFRSLEERLDPEKLQAALTLIRSGSSPSKAARQVGLSRSTLCRELALMPNAPPRTAQRTRLQKLPRIPA